MRRFIANGTRMRHTAIPTQIPRPASTLSHVNGFVQSQTIPHKAFGNRISSDVSSPGP